MAGRPARRFDGVLVSECTVAAATGFAMPSMIAVLPARLMNLPKKSYRLRTEQVSCSSPWYGPCDCWLSSCARQKKI